ncbi:MAG: DUF59 domain-containing protein [Candidatus Aenigmarchaeota archaeon]|nr:DUF59 domain-containing protein [Candidatus Aenigmarchaeota archaeon]
MTEKDAKKILEGLTHPEIDVNLVELGIVKDIKQDENKVTVTIAFPFPMVPIRGMIIESVRKALEDNGFEVTIQETVMTPEERERFFKLEREKWKF